VVAITLPILLISLSWADDRSPQAVRPQLKRPVTYDGKTIEEWVAILRGGNSFQRERAARLFAYSPVDKTAIEQLCHAIHDEDEQVAQTAMWAIDRLGPDAADAMPTLIKALKDQDEGVRMNAASAIGQIGRGAAVAVPALIAALKDDCEYVRGNAACALRNIGLRTPAVTEGLVKALDDKSDSVRSNAALALWKLSRTKRAISVLEETIKNGSALGRSVAADALGGIVNSCG
jgi:HEAT repeat protein